MVSDDGQMDESESGLLALPSRRDNLTYLAVVLHGGDDEKRKAVVEILKASQSQGQSQSQSEGRGKVPHMVLFSVVCGLALSRRTS